MSLKRIWLVSKLDLLKRVRSTRWIVSLVVWALALLFVVVTLYLVFVPLFGVSDSVGRPFWLSTVSLILYFTLGIGMIVSGTTASGSINGERNDATLALLQVTPVRGSEIVLGKILAAWLSSLTLLVIAAPFVLVVAFSAIKTVPFFLLGMLVVALMLLVSACIGVALSTLTPRPAGAATISFLLLAFLFVGTPMSLGIAAELSEKHVPYTTHYCYENWETPDGEPAWPEDPEIEDPDDLIKTVECEEINTERIITHHDRYWWFLLANPVVTLGDALPTTTLGWKVPPEQINNPMASTESDQIPPNYRISQGMHYLQLPFYESAIIDEKTHEEVLPAYGKQQVMNFNGGELWWISMVLFLGLGAAGAGLAISRTSVPIKKLSKGTRVA